MNRTFLVEVQLQLRDKMDVCSYVVALKLELDFLVCTRTWLGCAYIGVRTDTTQRSGHNQDEEVHINHVTVHVSGYTETYQAGMFSHNKRRMSGPNKVDLFRVHSLAGPPLWSSGQSFWLQIQRSRVRFPALPDFSEW